MKRRTLISILSLLGLCFAPHSPAQSTPDATKATAATAASAKKFLSTLDDGERSKVVFDFNDDAQRKRWSNLPGGIFRRAGLRMGDLTPAQREAAVAVLAAALSPQGYEKVLQIV